MARATSPQPCKLYFPEPIFALLHSENDPTLHCVKRHLLIMPLLTLVAVIIGVCCTPIAPIGGGADRPIEWAARTGPTPVAASGGSMSTIMRGVNLRQDLVPRGSHGRKVFRSMSPRYITIHSTQNWSANAWKHSQALKNGALRAPKRRGGNRIGYLIWHFTIDDKVAVQHMPTNEQGEHADFDGPGNRYSIGIEMCEHRGSNLNATVDRTARLAAYLMIKNGIPLRNVVPHYHWPRRGASPPNKNCPHFLMTNGKPSTKWRGFLGKVDYYYRQMK
jgi:N-acetylmuramoyl-L-alanine amidase